MLSIQGMKKRRQSRTPCMSQGEFFDHDDEVFMSSLLFDFESSGNFDFITHSNTHIA